MRFGVAKAPLLLALLLALVLPSAEGDEPNFEAARKSYETYLKRPSLFMRHRGRRKLAETRDPRALDILIKSYSRPEEPKEVVRSLLVDLCTRNFDGPEHVQTLRAWRKKFDKARDAWLWTKVLEIEGRHGELAEVIEIAQRAGDPYLRAAALEALARLEAPEGLPLATGAITTLGTSEPTRTLLLEGAASILSRNTKLRASPEFKALALQLAQALDEASTSVHARLTLRRCLARAYATLQLHEDAASWREHIEGRALTATTLPSRPHFFGVAASGRAIAYVIDLSDSMLEPLTREEIEDLKKVPAPPRRAPVVTAGDSGGGSPGNPGAAPAPPTADLPWDQIRTRFDAARAFLRLSLESLEPEEEFIVVGFGAKAELLQSTPSLRKATLQNVARAVGELLEITPGPRKPDRPHGTLWGYTNMHGGLMRALELVGTRASRDVAYVDPDLLEKGCDTIFLLSDGVPSWDDYAEWDTRESGDEAGDPESRSTTRDADRLHWYGPYAVQSWLLQDVIRANLFARMELHAIGIGEADPRLLQSLAWHGLGQSRQIGPARPR